jgi:uncharacterized protein YuzE
VDNFNLTQSDGDTAYLRFPGQPSEQTGIVAKSIRLNSLIEERLDFDISVDISHDGKVIGIEIIGD